MDEPSTSEYPYQVGRMIYRTLSEAQEACRNAYALYPTANLVIIDRRTGETVEVWS